MSEKFAFVASDPEQDGYFFASIDDPSVLDNEQEIMRLLRQGAIVRRVPLEDAKNGLFKGEKP
jgi:hypothetical protein